MADLAQELRDLGRRIEYPPQPDVAASVRRRLETEAAPARFAWRRRPLVVAVAVLVLAIAVAFAVPPARTAILRFFHIQGATVERVPTLPKVPPGAQLALGRRVTLEQAERLAGFRVLLPALGKPDDVYYDSQPPGGMISLVYGSKEHVHLLVSEFRGVEEPQLIEKQVGEETTIERVLVDGYPGIWVGGAPHAFMYRAPDGQVILESLRLANNALVWSRGQLTLRLEGRNLTKANALRIGASMR